MHEDPFALLGNSSSNSGQSGESEEEAGKEEGEEKEEEETRSQVPLDTSTILADFLIPGGLNAFPIALPAKLDRLVGNSVLRFRFLGRPESGIPLPSTEFRNFPAEKTRKFMAGIGSV